MTSSVGRSEQPWALPPTPQPRSLDLNDVLGFDLSFPQEYLRAALVISFISVWVLVGLYYYLNRYTRRRYFSIWAAAWLFYALWLTLHISLPHSPPAPWLAFLEQWCIGVSAVFLLWGSARFLSLRVRQFQLALFIGFLLVWSYVGAYELAHPLQARLPIFGLIGLTSLLTAVAFYRYRRRRAFVGAGLLAAGFVLWGFHLIANPFFELSEHLVSTGFVLSAVLQLFIAVSMIILVLEEVRHTNQATLERLHTQRTQTDALKRQADLSEERCRLLFEQATEGIVIAAADDLRILQINRTGRRMLGLDESETAEVPLDQLFPATPTSDRAEWFDAISAQPRFQLRRRDGLNLPVKVEGSPIRYEGRAAYQFFIHELTETARLEQRLREAEQLATFCRLAGSAARELRGPLATIQETLTCLSQTPSLNPSARAAIDRLSAETTRVVRVTGRLQSVAHRKSARRESTDLNTVLRRVLDGRLFDLRAARLHLVEHFATRLPPVHADPEALRRAFDAIITVHIILTGGQSNPVRLHITTTAPGSKVQATFEDDGSGLPTTLAKQLADPFFASMDEMDGPGPALLSAYSLFAEQDGHLTAQPSSLGGTGFLIELPAIDPNRLRPPTPPRPTPPAEAAAAAKILILDDDAAIATLLSEMLALLGHRAVIHLTGPGALDYLAQEPVDVILCDFWMPDMDGREFHDELAKRNPFLAQRIVFLTGDASNPEVLDLLKATGNPHLAKPFHLDAIAQTINQVWTKGTSPQPDAAANPSPSG